MLIRIVKDKNNPYVLLNKMFLEDPTLSLKAKGLMAFCMSKPDGWIFNTQHLSTVLLEGRESIQNAFKELIEKGYCERTQSRNSDGSFSKGDYILNEIPKTQVVDSSPRPEKPAPVKRGPVKPAPYIYSNTDIGISNEEQDNTSMAAETQNNLDYRLDELAPPPPPKGGASSAGSAGLALFFLQMLQTISPDMKKPSMIDWAKKFDLILRVDKRTEQDLRKVIAFILEQHQTATTDFTWAKACRSPDKLRKHYDAIVLQMDQKTKVKKTNDVPEEIQQQRREKVIKHYKENFHKIRDWFEDKVSHVSIGNDNIYYNNPKYEELVKHAMQKMEGRKL